ncbi:SDR family NAD(P)-dependent oxidoreductase [uncultured Phenylobacterium sp.]|uniref:SDR family NAD(P)-dependent oxidoreductase n=1 Tax=uncultured Phenylobacterium sp. TaxID=349273 RepID=UPI0025F0E712|nr:SDR family NAD(P)-dependent oxidoreductase [uncultured Phenylobacterium sp.]
MQLGVRTFEERDQRTFAVLSGDSNPMHMDHVAARRTQMGAPVVHGMHAVLWALELACQQVSEAFSGLRVNFAGPIYVGDPVEAALISHAATQAKIHLRVGNALATSITLELGPMICETPAMRTGPPRPATWPPNPLPLAFGEMAGQADAFHFARGPQDATAGYPALADRITPNRVGALVALSRLVGMICPGLHSIFSGVTLDFAPEDRPALQYECVEADPRFRRIRIAVAGGGIAGELTAFARLPPTEQPSFADIAAVTAAGAYQGATVLVVGGSRGLGEVTAKACAAGGAEVVITYAKGASEAEHVAEQIRAGGGRCRVVQFDAREAVAAQLAAVTEPITHLYYYATGPIAVRRTKFLSADVLADFMRFYTTAFVDTCEALVAHGDGARLRAFYPSSTAIYERPKGWAEYAMAKAAGEVLCREINMQRRDIEVIVERLPRLLTDQTAAVRPAGEEPALAVILPIVVRMQAP